MSQFLPLQMIRCFLALGFLSCTLPLLALPAPETAIVVPAQNVTLDAGQAVAFSATAAGDGAIVAYHWQLTRNGNSFWSNRGNSATTFTFAEAGTYVMSCAAEDEFGQILRRRVDLFKGLQFVH